MRRKRHGVLTVQDQEVMKREQEIHDLEAAIPWINERFINMPPNSHPAILVIQKHIDRLQKSLTTYRDRHML